jgi:pimeloyl-ACP methyl ester carboxylesterase
MNIFKLLYIITYFKNVLCLSKIVNNIKYNTYKWKNYEINYYNNINEKHNSTILFIHGYGSSLYHFRHNINELSKNHNIYAIDLLGFGKSDKPIIKYGINLWSNLITDFIDENINNKCVIVSHSIGGSITLDASTKTNNIIGCVLINPAGSIETNKNKKIIIDYLHKYIPSTIKSRFSDFIFDCVSNPYFIKKILSLDYLYNKEHVDDNLIASIAEPAKEKNTNIVFRKVSEALLNNYFNTDCKVPILLLWGIGDKWVNYNTINDILQLYPNTIVIETNGGHCHHDEIPFITNTETNNFVNDIFRNII